MMEKFSDPRRESAKTVTVFLSEIFWYFISRKIQFTSRKFSSRSQNCNWNSFFLSLLLPCFPDAPVCITDKIVIVGAYRSENLNVVCEVHADPPPRSFKWKFNSSGESYELPKERHYKNGSQSSILQYTPVMDQDYGTLTCAGQNEVGEQANPCVFQVILAGKTTTEQSTMTTTFHAPMSSLQSSGQTRKLHRREPSSHPP